MSRTVTLVDGRQVPSDSPEWRDECLARHVLALPDKAQRRSWLADFEAKHGQVGTADLRHTMQQVYDHQKTASPAADNAGTTP